MAAVYASTESPAVGDVVECTVKDCSVHKRRYTVEKVDGLYVHLDGDTCPQLAADFHKVSSPEPAPSSVEPVKGPPPRECLAAWYRFKGKTEWQLYARQHIAEWNADIVEHVPIEVGSPPPVEKVIELPKLFRAKFQGTTVVGIEWSNGWRHVYDNERTAGPWTAYNPTENLTELQYV